MRPNLGMILSPYRNPPYRTPTPKRPSSPPPHAGPSPKRKRDDSDGSHFTAMQVDTDDQSEQDASPGAESPRTKVAEKFRGLNIIPRVNESPDLPRKRLKRNAHLQEQMSLNESRILGTPDQLRHVGGKHADIILAEVGETPDCRTRLPSSPSALSGRLEALHESSDPLDKLDGNVEQVRRIPSPPPPTPLKSPQSTVVGIDRSVSPLQLPEELSFDQVVLTWQDDEITGHEIDPTGDDDGEGINGIGFKPTPAIAYARQQRRNQQVNEWKAREAREARQRRFERRRGEVGDATGVDQDANDDAAKRVVRFADVG